MVDDPATNPIISWGSFNTSFVIWDVIALQQELLPKYYNHKNLSSFIRQLNIYGFKKFDPTRWEFTNNGFVKGQKHILRNITRKKSCQSQENNICITRKSSQAVCQQNQNTCVRRKSSQGNIEQKQSQEGNNSWAEEKNTCGGACVEVGKLGIWEDVEILKKEKDVVMQELAKLSHHQQGADGKLHGLGQRLEGMEISQQQMLSFLAMVVQSPGFLGQLLQQNEGNWRISDTSKKRRFLACDELEQDAEESNEPVASDGQIVRYQPHKNDRPVTTSNWDTCTNAMDDFFKNLVFNEPVASDGQIVRYQPTTPYGSHGLDAFFPSIDENENVTPYLLEDGTLEKFLLATSLETTEPGLVGTGENGCSGLGSTNNNVLGEPSQALDRLTQELGLLVSEPNKEDES